MAMIRVHRKGYIREDGARVAPTNFMEKDRGKPGHGKKIIEIKHPGTLGEGFFSKSEKEQKNIVGRLAKKKGDKQIGGKLRAVQVLQKRTNPKVSKRAASLADWVYKNY